MRSREEMSQIKNLWSEGLSQHQISRLSGVPRSTVRDWIIRFRQGISWKPPAPERITEALPELSAEPHYVYLLGAYLGDGYINRTHNDRTFKLRIFCDSKQDRVIDDCRTSLSICLPKNKVRAGEIRGKNCVEVSVHSNLLPVLFPQIGPGRKHERKIRLTEEQKGLVDSYPLYLIKGLIDSDGTRYYRKQGSRKYLSYELSNKSQDIQKIFCGACDSVNIEWTQPYYKTIAIRRKSVPTLNQFISPKDSSTPWLGHTLDI